jgi:hypothetical protein
MNPAPSQTPPPLGTLTQREEAILRALVTLRYATRLDIAHLPVCAALSESYVRKLLANLAGGKDKLVNQYLCRFPRPQTKPGSIEKVYALGAMGRKYLITTLGERVDWWYSPLRGRPQSFSYLLHQLILTRLVCAAWHWSTQQSEFTLVQHRLSYELARTAPTVSMEKDDQQIPVTVVPDAFLLFERSDGAKFPVLVEIDRGTEYQERFKHHVRARLRLVKSGAYERSFGLAAFCCFAYATTGLTPEYRESRLTTMRQWTKEVVEEEIKGKHLQAWMGKFLFSTLVYEHIYEQANALFTKNLWYRPDSLIPIALLSEEPQPPQGETHDHDATLQSSETHGEDYY